MQDTSRAEKMLLGKKNTVYIALWKETWRNNPFERRSHAETDHFPTRSWRSPKSTTEIFCLAFGGSHTRLAREAAPATVRKRDYPREGRDGCGRPRISGILWFPHTRAAPTKITKPRAQLPDTIRRGRVAWPPARTIISACCLFGILETFGKPPLPFGPITLLWVLLHDIHDIFGSKPILFNIRYLA